MPVNDPEYQKQKAELIALHERLRVSAYRTANALMADARVLRSTLEDGTAIMEHPLCHGEWITAYNGTVNIMLLDDTTMCFKPECPMATPGCQVAASAASSLCQHEACTRVLYKSDGGPDIKHKHAFDEFVQVIQGTFEEGGTTLHPGQSRFFPAGVFHRPVVHGLMLVCWQPPLPRFNHLPEPLFAA